MFIELASGDENIFVNVNQIATVRRSDDESCLVELSGDNCVEEIDESYKKVCNKIREAIKCQTK